MSKAWKSINKLGMEALNWEIVRIEAALHSCRTVRNAVLSTVRQAYQICPEVSKEMLSALDLLEREYRERMSKLEWEQAHREGTWLG